MFYIKYFAKKLVAIFCNFFFTTKFVSISYEKIFKTKLVGNMSFFSSYQDMTNFFFINLAKQIKLVSNINYHDFNYLLLLILN